MAGTRALHPASWTRVQPALQRIVDEYHAYGEGSPAIYALRSSSLDALVKPPHGEIPGPAEFQIVLRINDETRSRVVATRASAALGLATVSVA